MIADAGLEQVKVRNLSGGIAAMPLPGAVVSAVSSSLHLLHAGLAAAGPAHALRPKSPSGGAAEPRAGAVGPAYIKLAKMLATSPNIVGIESPRRWSIFRTGCRLFRTSRAGRDHPRFRKPVEARFSPASRAMAAAPSHRCIAPKPAIPRRPGRGRFCVQGARAIRPDLEAWPSFAALPNAFGPKRGGCVLLRWWRPLRVVALELNCGWKPPPPGELYERTRGERNFAADIDWSRTPQRLDQ